MSGWNKSRTSMQEVGGSLYRVMRVICRQCNTDYTEGGARDYNTSGYKGEYKLSFPQDWNANAVTMVKVESVAIAGIPGQYVRAGNDVALEQDKNSVCMPRSFAIRSNALGGGGSTIEAKRHRGDITEADGGERMEFFTTAGSKYAVQTGQSNILQMIPNPENLGQQGLLRGNIHSAGGSEATDGVMGSVLGNSVPISTLYSVYWDRPVNLNTCGTTIGCGGGQTTFDLYVTNNYDYPQNKNDVTGVEFEPRLLLANTFQGNYVYDPALNQSVYPDEQVQNPIPYECGQLPGWDIVLVFYQLADSPRN